TNIANVLTGLRRYEEAMTQYRKALATFEVLLGADSLSVAHLRSNIGQMLQEWGKYSDARVMLERAFSIQEKRLGSDDASVTKTLANLGYLALAERQPQR